MDFPLEAWARARPVMKSKQQSITTRSKAKPIKLWGANSHFLFYSRVEKGIFGNIETVFLASKDGRQTNVRLQGLIELARFNSMDHKLMIVKREESHLFS
jgi:hypothetical protein